MNRNEFGVFELEIKGKNGKAVIPHGSKIKVKRDIPVCFPQFTTHYLSYKII
jgi:hypothetical protein